MRQWLFCFGKVGGSSPSAPWRRGWGEFSFSQRRRRGSPWRPWRARRERSCRQRRRPCSSKCAFPPDASPLSTCRGGRAKRSPGRPWQASTQGSGSPPSPGSCPARRRVSGCAPHLQPGRWFRIRSSRPGGSEGRRPRSNAGSLPSPVSSRGRTPSSRKRPLTRLQYGQYVLLKTTTGAPLTALCTTASAASPAPGLPACPDMAAPITSRASAASTAGDKFVVRGPSGATSAASGSRRPGVSA